jgi:hypothetical protein
MPEVKGSIRLANGLSASGLTFQLYKEVFGGEPVLVTEVTTDEQGRYSVDARDIDERTSLVAKVPDRDEPWLAPLTSRQETGSLHFVAPATAVSTKSEFTRLQEALAPVLGDHSLGGAVEDDKRSDITVAHRETGWDARLIAVSALAQNLELGMGPEATYALLRAGLPNDPALLMRVPTETVKAVLVKAVEAGIVELSGRQADAAVRSFEDFAIKRRLETRPAGGLSSVQELLEASGLADDPDGPRGKLQAALLDETATKPLWDRLKDEGLDDDQIAGLRAKGRLAFLTTNNLPLMRHVEDKAGNDGLVGSLAREAWDEPATWTKAIRESGGNDAVPAVYGTEEGAIESYANELARRVRLSYPTEVIAGQVTRGTLDVGDAAADDVAKVLASSAQLGFRIGTESPAAFLSKHPDLLDGDDARKLKTATTLDTLHRAYQLSPSNEAMQVLLAHGLTSAFDVIAMSEVDFLDRYGSYFGGLDIARLVYRKSEQVSAVLYNFHAMTQQAIAAPVLGPVQGDAAARTASVDRLKESLPSPTMETLFGSMDYCECDHCRSVLGPAAYLVDLLKFLDPDATAWQGFKDVWKRRHQGADYPFATPYDELMERRPDLAYLSLTCENTNTVMPTIDLVNEILEFILAKGALDGSTVHDSGQLPTEEVMAEPEFIEASVYDDVLRTSKTPSVLPFDLWHETTRAYADRLKVPLVDLLGAFAETKVDALAAERLGLTEVEYAVITGDDPFADWWTRFGFTSSNDALAALGNAKRLCRISRIDYQDLADLLGTRWLNPGLVELGLLTTAGVSVADAVVWRTRQDLLAVAAEPADPDEGLAWNTVQSAQRRLAAVDNRFDLKSPNTAGATLAGLADAKLQAIVVLADPDPTCNFDKTYFATAGGQALDGDKLATLAVRIDVFLRLRRRLGWTTQELDTALAAYASAASPWGDPLRAAIRRIARQRQLADLVEYDGPQASLTALWAPLDRATYDAMFGAGPMRDRDPVFAAPFGTPLEGVPAGTKVGAHLVALQSALGLTATELTAIMTVEGKDLDAPLDRALLEMLHRYSVVGAAVSSAYDASISDLVTLRRLSGIAAYDGSADADVLGQVDLCRKLAQSELTASEVALLLAYSFDPAGDLRPDAAATTEALTAITAALAGLAVGTPQERDAARPMLIKAVSAALGRPQAQVADLLTMPPLSDGYYSLATSAPDLVSATTTHELLGRVLLLTDRLKLDAAEVAEFMLATLPTVEVAATAPLLPTLVSLLDYVAVRKAAAGGSSEVITALAAARGAGQPAARLESALAIVARLSRRTAQEAADVATALGLDAAALGTVPGLVRLWRALQLVSRSGVPATTLAGWADITQSGTAAVDRHRIAKEARDALRARTGVSAWQRVAGPVNDRLRGARRDALVAAALVKLDLGTIEELYQYLLLDPGSEPVLRTSRVRQAISSVQIYIQRCLLGVEPSVHPSTLDADHWAWMRRYRVWEANRKIFLFPENWLEPEFRDDKSHLFQELESTLVQGDVTDDLVEDAFLTYLRKLDEIARLEVCGLYWEQDPIDPGNNTLHVLGRTHGLPKQYFYRRQQHGAWTPWDPMGVEIEGDHIVPVIWRNRLHVFWVSFLEQPDSDDASPADDGMDLKMQKMASAIDEVVMGVTNPKATAIGSAPKKKAKPLAEATMGEIKQSTRGDGVSRSVQIALHWSEYVAGKWSAPTGSGFGRIPSFSSRYSFDPSRVFVHCSIVYDADGTEAGVQVHLTGDTTRTVLLRGRNSPVEQGTNQARPPMPFQATVARVNHYDGGGSFAVTFAQKLTSTDGGAAVPSAVTLPVVGSVGSYSLTPPSNAVTLGGSEIGSLISPFFFADSRRTFFVEPSLVETTTETFESYLVPDAGPTLVFPPEVVDKVHLRPYVPELVKPDYGLPDPDEGDPWPELFQTLPSDVLTGPATGVMFGDKLMGPRGSVNVTIAMTGSNNVNGPPVDRFVVTEQPQLLDTTPLTDAGASDLRPEAVAVVHPDALAEAGLSPFATHVEVAGASGLASHLADQPDVRFNPALISRLHR